MRGGSIMSVYVVIKRKLRIVAPEKLFPLLESMRLAAGEQPGYIKGITLRSQIDPDDYLVISQWETAQDWQNWLHDCKRREIQGEIDSLIGEKTFYEVYDTIDHRV
jgi:heme-degrading monooxygenase HmoA